MLIKVQHGGHSWFPPAGILQARGCSLGQHSAYSGSPGSCTGCLGAKIIPENCPASVAAIPCCRDRTLGPPGALHALLCLAAVSSVPPQEPLQGAVDAWSWCLSTLPPGGCSGEGSGRAQGAKSRYGDLQREDTQGCIGKKGPSSWGQHSERFLSLLWNYRKGFSTVWSL